MECFKSKLWECPLAEKMGGKNKELFSVLFFFFFFSEYVGLLKLTGITHHLEQIGVL